MIPTLYIVDDFLEAPDKALEQAAQGPFEAITFQGAAYRHINHLNGPDIRGALNAFLGREVDMKLQAVRLDLAGEFPHNHAHADDYELQCEWASVLYLNRESFGGTAFWKHKESGLHRTSQDQALNAKIWRDWTNKEAWDMCGFAGMKFNRAVIYPTSCFHSRFPHEGFGTNELDGRMVHVAFFN